jgi:hypothetical protein
MEEELLELYKKLEEAEIQIDRGETISAEEVFKNLKERYFHNREDKHLAEDMS